MESCDCIDIFPSDDYLVILQRYLDMLIAIALFLIPLELIYQIWALKMVTNRWEFILFGTFLTICGATYFTDLWRYNYSKTVAMVTMAVKLCAALISWLTSLSMIYIFPNLLNLRNREYFLKTKTSQLSKEMDIILQEEEMTRNISKLINEIRSTLDGKIIFKSTVDGLGQIFGLEECAMWFPSQTNKSLELCHSLNHSRAVGSNVSMNLPVMTEIFSSPKAVEIPHTCPLVRTRFVTKGFTTPEIVAIRVPLLHYSSTGPDEWFKSPATRSYGAMILVLPSDNIRRFHEYELELVEAVAEQVSIALAHVSATKESAVACDHLLKQNASLEIEVRDLKMEVKDAMVSKSAIFHYMLTPLHAMIILLSILLESKLTPEQRASVETVLHESNSLDTLIKSEIELYELEDGTLELNKEVFKLSSAFKQVIDMIKPVAVVKKISLLMDLAPDLPVNAVGDREKLMQIILNVVGNAVKFTKEGHVSITASVALPELFQDWRPSKLHLVSSRDHFYLKVEVEDTGCGIAPKESATILRRFTALKSSSNQSTKSGLGLAICRRLLDAMEGHIWVESDGLDKGTTATFIVKLGTCNANTLQLQPGLKMRFNVMV